MEHTAKSIRPFLGSKHYETSRNFYRDLGFEEVVLSPNMSLFRNEVIGFYLQDAYVKDWVDNTMVFMEVGGLDGFWNALQALGLPNKYEGVKLSPIKDLDWGRECFLHDPSGILWHIGSFKQ